MKKQVLLASAAALMTLAAPASAADVVFSGNSSTDGTNGNDRAFSGTGFNGEATAWTITGGNKVNNAYLGIYGGGLGVTNDSEGSGGGTSHTVDNDGQVDFILLRFDKAVNLSALSFDSFGDTDVSIRYGNLGGAYTTSPSWDNNTAWSTVTGALPNTFDSTGGDTDGWRNLGTPANAYANTWIVSALFPANGTTDSFKLKGIRVTAAPAVPEPATWLMMIMGFGLVGGVMRRKKAGMEETVRFA